MNTQRHLRPLALRAIMAGVKPASSQPGFSDALTSWGCIDKLNAFDETGNSESLKQTQADSGASFLLLSDIEMTVTRLYDMQLRPGWPMAGMGDIPEMGYVVVGADGRIKLQRVGLYFGDNASDVLAAMKDN